MRTYLVHSFPLKLEKLRAGQTLEFRTWTIRIRVRYVLDTRCRSLGTDETGSGRVDKDIRIIHQSMWMPLDYLESRCTVEFRAKTKSSVKRNFLPNLASCYYDIPDLTAVGEILHGPYVRRQCVPFFCRVEDIRLRRCRTARIMTDGCQRRAQIGAITNSQLMSVITWMKHTGGRQLDYWKNMKI